MLKLYRHIKMVYFTHLKDDKPTNNSFNKKPWFNAECYSSRKQFTKTRNAFNRDKSNATLRNEFLTAKANYKRIQRESKSKYQLN